MRGERRAILALMAAGRITAGEAMGLLRAWDARFEGLWVALLCGVVLAAELAGQSPAGGWGHWVHSLVLQGADARGAAAGLLHKWMGGTI